MSDENQIEPVKRAAMRFDYVRAQIAACGGVITIAEIARRTGMSRQGVAWHAKHTGSFPRPLKGGGYYLAAEVDAWHQGRVT